MRADQTAIEAIPLSSGGPEASRRGGGSTGIGEDSSNNACGRAAQNAFENRIDLLRRAKIAEARCVNRQSSDKNVSAGNCRCTAYVCVVNGGKLE